jgi:hypothetical protein
MAGQNYCIVDGCLLSLSLCRRGFQDLLKVRPSSLFILCGGISSSIASLMSRYMYPVLAERSFVSYSLIMCSWLMLCSVTADLPSCAVLYVYCALWYEVGKLSTSGTWFRASAMTTMNKKPTGCTIVLKSLKLYFILGLVVSSSKAGRYNKPNDTRWLEAVCAELGGSWWWAQECPKHVKRNKNKIKF